MNPLYEVLVTHKDGVWIGECDELGLVAEAKSYQELTERACELAHWLYQENSLGEHAGSIRISFT